MQQINYSTLADFFKLFYSVLIGGPIPSAEGTGVAFDSDGQLAADKLLECLTLDQTFAISDMECERTIRLPEHGLDPIDANVAVCCRLPDGQSQLEMNGDDVVRIHGKILLLSSRLDASLLI